MPAAPRQWAMPFLAQAREDLKAAWTMDKNAAASTFCMLMQMVFEKLSKAAYARLGNVVPHTHRVTSHLLVMLRRHPAAARIPQVVPGTLGFVAELELAHPQIAGHAMPPCPQLEYPWENPQTGKVCSPAADLPFVKRVRDPRDRIAVDILKLASALEARFDEIFPDDEHA